MINYKLLFEIISEILKRLETNRSNIDKNYDNWYYSIDISDETVYLNISISVQVNIDIEHAIYIYYPANNLDELISELNNEKVKLGKLNDY